MFEIVEKEQPKERIELTEVRNYFSNNKIILTQKGTKQEILIYDGSAFQWANFYLRGLTRSRYRTMELAIQSRLDKNEKVYILSNKRELKEIINHM